MSERECVACLAAEATGALDDHRVYGETATLTLLAVMIAGGLSVEDIAGDLCDDHGAELASCVHNMKAALGGAS